VATSVLGACRRAPISTSAVITIDGSSTVYPLAEALAEDFRLGEPATRVTIGVAGTGGGLRRFCRGELDLATASRPITRQEAAACEASGVRFVELPLAYDGIVIAVHPSNHWVEALSVADLARLWQHEAQGRIVRWAQWKPGYPEREIHLFGAGVDSGTFDYFTGVVTGAPRDSRGDYTSSEDDNMLVQGVATDPDALGYFGFAYYEAHQEYLRAVPIRAQDGMPAVLPTRESIRTGGYRPAAARSTSPARVRHDARPRPGRGRRLRAALGRRTGPGGGAPGGATHRLGRPRGPRGGASPVVTARTRAVVEGAIERALAACAALSILVTAGIVVVLAWEALAFFREVSPLAFLTGRTWTPLFLNPQFGVLPLVAGTLLVTVIALVVAVPAGLVSALYLSEYAPSRVRRVAKPALEMLAGVPTVVYGYFALLFVTPLLRTVIPGMAGYNALAPGLVMGLMILPLVSSLCEDALSAVPRGLREGAFALGATRHQAALGVVLPAAFSGVAAAVVLAVSRAIGETMIVAIAAGQQPRLTANPLVPVETMTAFIVQVSLGDVPAGTREYRTIFAVGALLFCGTFALNLCSDWLRRRLPGGRR
jgi:phosphate ABC transporter permease protein PstC